MTAAASRSCPKCGGAFLRRRGVSRPGATYFCRQAKVGKSWLRGMKLSYLIAKGRRTVLKISPPKNPRIYTGAVTRKAWQSSAARGCGTASALATTDVDPVFSLPTAASDTSAASPACLPVPRRSRAPAADERPGRRGSGDESAGIIALAAPSETEGAESGAEARRYPRAGKRPLHLTVHPWGT